jgi:hypothetical protein
VFVNTTFRGRKYYAWYAPEIAVYSGLGIKWFTRHDP